MPVTMRILRGPNCFVSLPTSVTSSFITRKKKRTAIAPRPSDHFAFRWNGDLLPQLVVRSPLNLEVWITKEERQVITDELIEAGWAFATRKGPYLIKPENGATGWLPVGRKGRRFFHEHNGFGWNQKYPERDDGL